jgi:putative spermidine/putrescine transport system substrate-binding protein
MSGIAYPHRPAVRPTRRDLLKASAASGLGLLGAAASRNSGHDAQARDDLIAAAKAEGSLTNIGLPHENLNYAAVFDGFKAKYGLQITELDSYAGSGDQLQAIRANKENRGPQAPDVIDVGFSFGPTAQAEGLLQLYKVSTWETIPDELKDPDGYWYGDYYGAISFVVNTDAVDAPPADWADLLKPAYKGQIALTGDPRVSNSAIMAVYASALANGGSLDDAKPGLEFFAKLAQSGNLVPVIGTQATLVAETPILFVWDYSALTLKDMMAGNPPLEVVWPRSGLLGGLYVQGISAFAPHPNAAKLWMEYLYSDEVQLIWLAAYGHPVRYNDLVQRNEVPADVAAKLPSPELYANVAFPTIEQQEAAKKTITEGWDEIVKVNFPG